MSAIKSSENEVRERFVSFWWRLRTTTALHAVRLPPCTAALRGTRPVPSVAAFPWCLRAAVALKLYAQIFCGPSCCASQTLDPFLCSECVRCVWAGVGQGEDVRLRGGQRSIAAKLAPRRCDCLIEVYWRCPAASDMFAGLRWKMRVCSGATSTIGIGTAF